MNHDPSRLRQNQRTDQTHAETTQSQQAKTFGSVEELFRHDASQVDVPPGVEERLKQSLASEKPPKGGWWRRWFNAR